MIYSVMIMYTDVLFYLLKCVGADSKQIQTFPVIIYPTIVP